MKKDEYEAKRRRLDAEIDKARRTYLKARAVYDRLCDESHELRCEWREQKAST